MHFAIRILLYVIISSIPLITGVFLLTLFGKNLSQFWLSPYINDQIMYWFQARAYQAGGFESGYFTVQELPADYARFYAWGPLLPVFYGTVGRVFDWKLASPVLINVLLLGCSLLVLLLSTRPDRKQLLAIALFLTIFPTVLLYFPTAMSELIHLAIAVLTAGIFYRLLNREPGILFITLSLTFFLLASFLRFTWVIFVFPFFMLLPIRRSFLQHSLIAGALTIIYIGIAGWWMISMNAPYPFGFFYDFSQLLLTDLGAALLAFIQHAKENNLLFRVPGVERAYNILLIAIIIFETIRVLYARFKKSADLQLHKFAFLHVYNLLGILMIILFMYDVAAWRGFRVMSGHLLIYSLLVILSPTMSQTWSRHVGVLLVSFIFMLPMIGDTYSGIITNNFPNNTEELVERVNGLQREIAVAGVQYNPETENGWCNTVLVSLNLLNPEMLLPLDPRLGISVIIREITLPARSMYGLLGQADYQKYGGEAYWSTIVELDDSITLYRNKAANC